MRNLNRGDHATRDFYLHLAQQGTEPEPLPLDAPDWDWPDAPDPGVNDRLEKHLAWGWLALSTIITTASLIYLVSQVI